MIGNQNDLVIILFCLGKLWERKIRRENVGNMRTFSCDENKKGREEEKENENKRIRFSPKFTIWFPP